MKKALLDGKKLVRADDYTEAPKGELSCEDERCSAPMEFRKEYWAGGNVAHYSAAFVSKDVKEHRPDCWAHDAPKYRNQAYESIGKAIVGAGPIEINLNCELVKESLRGHFPRRGTVSARTVDDLLSYFRRIEQDGGDAALERTVIKWREMSIPLKEFFIDDNQDQYRDLFKRMIANPKAHEPPYLIRFNPTKNTHENKDSPINGTPVKLPQPDGKSLILLEKLVTPEFDGVLRTHNSYVVAIPRLNRETTGRKMKELESVANDQAVFIALEWKILGSYQFTPAEEPAPHPTQTKSAPRQKPFEPKP